MNLLEVSVAEHCFGYDEALKLATEISQSLPHLQVKVRNLDETTEGDLPETIATSSHFLNSRLLFLGNPRLEGQRQK